MKASELKLNNFVRTTVTHTTIQISIDELLEIINEPNDHQLEPIPLTEEWLEKFGFEENTTSFTKIEGRHHYVVKLRKSHKRFHSFTHKPIDFVHDLQNIYFALTGEELTIKNK